MLSVFFGLGPKPSFYFLTFRCYSLKNCFPPEKGHSWSIFECLPLFLLSLFWPPTFQFLFLWLSISLVSFFHSSFLSFFFAFFWFLVFVSFFPCLSSLLLFHARNTIKLLNYNFNVINSFSFLVSCLAFSFKSLCLIFVFS